MENRAHMMCCASCGIAGGDDIKLKDCSACHLVRYCGIECQKDHRPQHKKDCKKRAAELRDELLFKQPESSHLGDCPICCLPLPLDPEKYTLNSCCCKIICDGCNYVNQKREIEGRLENKCAFCRTIMPKTKEENKEQVMKRIEANDTVALCHMGTTKCDKGDYRAAFDYWTRAANLGDAISHYQLSVMYRGGIFVEKDEKKELHHLTEATIARHPKARYNLGCLEGDNGQYDRATKHWIIGAKLGHDMSMEGVNILYEAVLVSHEDFAVVLRGHQAAIAAIKSPQREEAANFFAEREKRGAD